MSARDKVIDHLAENIDPGPARTLSVRAGAKKAEFPAGDVTVLELWASIVKQLESVHGNEAFDRLFEVLVKDYPRTVEEARTLLEAPADAGLESSTPNKRISNRARRIRIYGGDDEVWWMSRAGEVSLDVWVSAKARHEVPPKLVVTGEDETDLLEIADPELDKKHEWWIFDVTLTRSGLARRDLQFRVADTPKTKQSLAIVNPWLWYSGGAAVLLASLICAAVYLETFPRIPGASWGAMIGALPALPIVAGVLSLTPPLAKLRVLFLYPARLFLGAFVLLVLALIPGFFLVAVENGTTQTIRIGTSIEPDHWIVVSPSRLDRDAARLCRTQASRAPGLDAFLPRTVVTGVPGTWPVLGERFGPNTIMTASGGIVRGSDVVFECDRDARTRPTAEVKHRESVIHVPYPWTVSVVAQSGERAVQLHPPEHGSDTLAETQLLSAEGGTLRCASSGLLVIEPLFSGLATRSISIESSNKISRSKWSGSTSAWRCRFDAETTSLAIDPLGATNTLDLSLPQDLGTTTVTFAGASAVVRGPNRFVHVRPATFPAELTKKNISIDDGELRLESGLAILSLASQGPKTGSFSHDGRNYKLSVTAEGSLTIVRDEMPSGPCTYFMADKNTTHRKPSAQMTCTKSDSDNQDAKRIASVERNTKRYSCTDVYICNN